LCTRSNIEDLIEKIVSYGGKQRMPIREYYPKDKPFKMCYVEDPFELFRNIHTQLWTNLFFGSIHKIKKQKSPIESIGLF
jgi:hypothetical protein